MTSAKAIICCKSARSLFNSSSQKSKDIICSLFFLLKLILLSAFFEKPFSCSVLATYQYLIIFFKEIPIFSQFYSVTVRKYIFSSSLHLMSPLKVLCFVYSGKTCHTDFSTYPDLWCLLISPCWFWIFTSFFNIYIYILVHLKWSVHFQNINQAQLTCLVWMNLLQLKLKIHSWGVP